jgi:hypothetical protein
MAIKCPNHIRSYDDAWDCFVKNKHKLTELYADWQRDIKPHLEELGLDPIKEEQGLMRRAGTMIQQWVGTEYAREIMCYETDQVPLIEQHGGVTVVDPSLEGFQVSAPEPRNYGRNDRQGATKL